MNKYNSISYFIFLLTILFVSCKKDKQHFDKIITLHSNNTDRLNNILVRGNTIYIVGGDRFTKATIVISRDAGNTWQTMDFPVAGKELFGIAASPNGTVYTCGFDAKLLWSNDNGHNWNFAQMSNWQPYKDLEFLDNNKAIGIMGVSYKSGGRCFIDSLGGISQWDSTATEYNDIAIASDASTGYISGYGIVMKTSNGGHTWNYQNIKNDNFTAISIVNKDDVWTCGIGGSIFHTTDGGNTWNRKRNGNDLLKTKHVLHDLLFIDSNTGWCVGEGGLVLHTKDGGSHWIEYEKFTNNILRSIALLPDGNLLVCGDNGCLYKLVR
jgi:hypothetical protein